MKDITKIIAAVLGVVAAVTVVLAVRARNAAQVDINSAISYFNMGDRYFYELNMPETATPEYRDAAGQEENNAEYHYGLAVTLDYMGRYHEALPEQREAVRLAPDNAEYHNGLAVTLDNLERHEEALTELREAVRLVPDKAGYHYGLGCILYELERYEEAEKETRTARNAVPNEARYHHGLGQCLFVLSRWEEALEELQEAARLDSDYQEDYERVRDSIQELAPEESP